MPVVNDYTALLSGSYWNGIEVTGHPVIVTFSFPTSLPAYDASIDGFTPATVSSFQAFTPTEQAQAITALNEWAAASGLIFVQVAPGEGDLNFQNVDFDTTSGPSYAGAGGIGFYPFGDWNSFSYPYFSGDLDASGEVFMNTQFLTGGAVDYGTLLHEIGHAIGLKHPTEVVTDQASTPDVVHDNVLSSDDPTRTIMATVGGNPDPHLLQLDKDAAAFIYGTAGTGAVLTASASGSNAVSIWSWNAVTETLTQTAATVGAVVRGSSVKDVINGSTGDDQLFGLAGDDRIDAGLGNDKLYGGAGTNTLIGGGGDDSYYVASSSDTITELAGDGNDVVYATASFALPDNVEALYLYGPGLTGKTNNQGAQLFGDGFYATTLIGGTGADYMVGGSGADTLAGGGGADLMYGQGGADSFVFTSPSDAPTGGALVTIGDFVSGEDRIDLSAIKTTGSDPGQDLTFVGTAAFTDTAGEVRQFGSGGNTIIEGDVDGDGNADFRIQLNGADTLQASDFAFEPVCYCAGTRILTDQGEAAVEDLSVGSGIVTASGRVRPVRWLGHRCIDLTRHPRPETVAPIRIQRDAFADNVPHRDLLVSPDHAVFVDGVLICARQLVNGSTIRRETGWALVDYYHVELNEHAILLAEGLPAESYLDTGNRGFFANAGAPLILHPDLTDETDHLTRETASCAPFVWDEANVRPVWQRLADRAGPSRQVTTTTDADPRLVVDQRTIKPVLSDGEHVMFMLPRGASQVRLISRAQPPTKARPWLSDQRRLGVRVRRIVLRDGDETCEIPMDHPAIAHGWWDIEHDGPMMSRWTDGEAVLRLPPMRGPTMLEIHLAGAMTYAVDATPDEVTKRHVA